MISLGGLGEAIGVGEAAGAGDTVGVGNAAGVGEAAGVGDGLASGEFMACSWFGWVHADKTNTNPATIAARTTALIPMT
jgi:hypothetical protein